MNDLIKIHRVWAEINLDNIAFNTKLIKDYIAIDTNSSPETKPQIMAIIKADAYGHGAIPVAKELSENGITYLGVATIEEAVEIKNHNKFSNEPISAQILILGYIPHNKIHEAIEIEAIQTVYSLDMANIISMEAQKQSKVAKIHIKIDTGMSRLGFLSNHESVSQIAEISKLPFVEIDGLYTHLSTSDNPLSSNVSVQENTFLEMISNIEEENISCGNLRHISNSGAFINFPDTTHKKSPSYDLVRTGLILYGISPSSPQNTNPLNGNLPFFDTSLLRHAMELKTVISHVKEVFENTPVGYGQSFFTDRKTKIATIPVGYADGYFRKFGNCAKVIVETPSKSYFAPIIGTICMDQFMIDVTEIENIENIFRECTIILIGKSNDLSISADNLAEIAQTISYEIICSVGKRVPRIYIKNSEIL